MLPSVRPSDAVFALQAAMRDMPQVAIETQHLFADGMYARIVPRLAGTLIVGKMHKREHFYIVACGRVAVSDGDGPAVEYGAGTVLVSKPGVKRAVLALEESVCLTVHRTDSTNLDEIEAELVERDETALFDARNHPRALEDA